MPKSEKDVPHDAYEAFYKGYPLESNPFPEYIQEFEEWDRDWIDAYNNYKKEGRFRDGSFKG